MEAEGDRRVHKRLALKLVVMCQKVGLSSGGVYTGNTVNVSSGGLLMEVVAPDLEDGELLSVEMSVPPTEGLLQYGGRLSGYARVIRVGRPETAKHGAVSAVKTIALEFCESPRLQV